MRRGPKFVATLVAVALVAVLTALDQTVVSTALPRMIAELQGASILGWVFTAYFVSATATVALAGKLADLFGRRTVFITSVAIFLVGSLLCGLANSMLLLVLFRALQGIGAGCINTLSFIVMADLFSARERGKWQAINNIGFATASAIGPSVGGILSDNASWRWIFLINVPICVITLGVVWYGLQTSGTRRERVAIDWAGASWSIVSIVAILLVLTWGGRDFAWFSPQIVVLVTAALLAGALLWWTEGRARDPLIPARILNGPVVPYACLAFFATFFVWFTMILLAPLRLQLVLGTTATEAGALLTPGIVLSPICALITGQLLSRLGRCRLTARAGSALQLIGLAMLLFVPSTAPQLWILASFAVVGMGTGFTAPSLMIGYQNAVPHGQLGAAIGMLSLFRQLGASVGTAVIGAIVGASVAESATVSVSMAAAINTAVLVQLAAGMSVVLGAWLMADLPLGTTRGGDLESGSKRGAAWSQVVVDR
jgi:EmrB/QacA subfamily drug resistance transporter